MTYTKKRYWTCELTIYRKDRTDVNSNFTFISKDPAKYLSDLINRYGRHHILVEYENLKEILKKTV